MRGTSVYNHYNRVRANIAATRQDDLEWAEDTSTVDDGLSYGYILCLSPYKNCPVQQEVAPARLMPHPQRLQMGYPLQTRQSFPLFEKSNVLVM